MSGFGHYDRTAAELEDELVTHGILLGLDWENPAQVRALAHEALSCTSAQRLAMLHDPNALVKAKSEIFALSEMMLDLLRQGAQTGVHVPGVGVWEIFGQALVDASQDLPGVAPSPSGRGSG
jgi:hypothetical protein